MEKLLEIHDRIERKASNCTRILEVMGSNPPMKAISEYAISEAAGIPLEEVKECLGIMQRSGRVRKATTKDTDYWESSIGGSEKMTEKAMFEINVPDHDR